MNETTETIGYSEPVAESFQPTGEQPQTQVGQSEETPKKRDYFETTNGRRMFYEPDTIVGSSDAFYIVQKGGNWLKFAEYHRKKGWTMLRMNRELLDHALSEMKRLKDAREAAQLAEESKYAELYNASSDQESVRGEAAAGETSAVDRQEVVDRPDPANGLE